MLRMKWWSRYGFCAFSSFTRHDYKSLKKVGLRWEVLRVKSCWMFAFRKFIDQVKWPSLSVGMESKPIEICFLLKWKNGNCCMVTEVPHIPRPGYSYFLSPGLQFMWIFQWPLMSLPSSDSFITWLPCMLASHIFSSMSDHFYSLFKMLP